MALGPIGSDPRILDSLVTRAGTSLSTAARGAEVGREERVRDDAVTLGSTPRLEWRGALPDAREQVEGGGGGPPESDSPRVRSGSGGPPPPPGASDLHAPLVQLDEHPVAPEVLDSGGKLGYEQHLQLMAEAAARGTQTVSLKGASGVARDIHIHGASEKELQVVSRSLRNLAAVDPYDIILHDVQDIYMADTLGTGHGGNPVAGVAVKQSSGETAITLSRLQGQASRNQLESPSHVDDVLYHEIGHVVDNRHNLSAPQYELFGKGDAGKIGAGGDFVSRYAATSTREDYAESFSDFFVGRASPLFRGLSDKDVVDMTLFAHDDKGKAVEKLRRIPRDLSPELHVKAFTMDFTEKHHDEGIGPRQMVRQFYDDQAFRAKLVDDCVAAYPAVPRESVYDYMQGLAELFHEAPYPER